MYYDLLRSCESISVCDTILLLSNWRKCIRLFPWSSSSGIKGESCGESQLVAVWKRNLRTINPYVVFVLLQFCIASMQSHEHTCLCRSRITRYRTRVSQVVHSRIENRLCVPRFDVSFEQSLNEMEIQWSSNEMDREYSRAASNLRWKISWRDIRKEDSKIPIFSTLESLTFWTCRSKVDLPRVFLASCNCLYIQITGIKTTFLMLKLWTIYINE